MIIEIKPWTDARIVDQINLSNKNVIIAIILNDILELLDKVKYDTRVLAAIT
jgi:hypothetical protein